MQRGLVSAGNAFRLCLALKAEPASQKLSTLLHDWGRQATERSVGRVLATSELLLPELHSDGGLERLLLAAQKAGFGRLHFLLILRAPVEQLLSLYKHRAKRGTAGEIAEWCASGYRLPHELAGFRRQAEALGIDLTVRGYSREKGALERRFFVDWLGVPVPDVAVPARVNPSLTLSELALVRQMAAVRPELVEPLYEAMSAVDPGEKVQGQALSHYARAVATQVVAEHAAEWEEWNHLLPADERLPIPEAPADLPPRPDELGFSEVQMQALADFMARTATSGFVAETAWKSRIRPRLGRVKRAILRPD
ncbi:hypothetical protein [Rhodovulum adriaticum]|nr:hypothetical protein [Rhodovulum adriaticum]